MILKFADFWTTHKPELIVTEYHVFSDNHEYAGTADLVVRIDNKLGIRGVYFYYKKYRVQICLRGKHFFVGSYKTIEEATKAYDDAAIKIHGRFARPNIKKYL